MLMADIDFADGFDVPEPLAWGLTPTQLGTALTGALLAYLALHSSLPPAVAVPLAAAAAAAGLALALIRRDGRPLIEWAAVAARFWARPRRGLLTVVGEPAPSTGRREGMGAVHAREANPGRPRSETVGRMSPRVSLVLLPEPVEPTGRPGAVTRPAGAGHAPLLGVADAALIEAPPRSAHRLTFFSLSGGTGRTTLAVEVAGLLAARARSRDPWGMLEAPRVALVDLDLLSPRAGIRLGVPTPTGWDLGETHAVAGSVERLLAVHPSGLRVLPGPARVLSGGATERPDLVGRLAAAVGVLEAGGCDTIVLDVPGDLSALTRWALAAAQEILVVLTPTAGGVHDAYRSTEALSRLGLRDRIRYVVNRDRGEPCLAEAMLDLGGTVVAEIPDDPGLEVAEMEHRLVGLEGSGPAAEALRALATLVAGGRPVSGRGAGAAEAGRLLGHRAS
jgi:MinD-like ATPase involved in chromosome partitioning or flagellar assembly